MVYCLLSRTFLPFLLLVFCSFGAFFVDTDNWEPFIPEPEGGEFGKFGWSGILRASSVIFFAYVGFDAVTTGASDDLRKVTQIVYQMIQVYGMNDRIGNLAFPKQVRTLATLDRL